MQVSTRRAAAILAPVLLALLLLLACADGRPTTSSGNGQKALQKQLKNLQRMKCAPKYQKFEVKTLLHPENDLLDKQLITNVVAIKRCDESCSYCGSRNGFEDKKCKPVKIKEKKFSVIYLGENGQREPSFFKAEEHKRCSCQ